MARHYSPAEIMALLRDGEQAGLGEAGEIVGDISDEDVPTDTRRLKNSRRVTVEPEPEQRPSPGRKSRRSKKARDSDDFDTLGPGSVTDGVDD